MSVNLLKTGAWAMIGGTAFAAVGCLAYNQWRRQVREDQKDWGTNRNIPDDHFQLPGGTLQIFAMGAVAGVAFKHLGIPAIQFLASGILKTGSAVYHHKAVFYNSIKWLFTK